MHKSHTKDNRNTLPKMPFVTGKSLTKSHNLGVTIQQTQSLLSIKMNKKLIQKQPSTTQLLQPDNFSNKSSLSPKSSTVTVSAFDNQDDICPILKYNTSYIINNPRWNEDKAKLNDTNKRTVDEIWADYMFDIESKNIIPLKCTCTQLRNINQRSNKLSQRKLEDSQPSRKRADLSVIYSEAEKIVKECHLLPQPAEGETIGEEFPLFVANQLKPTKSTTMAKYMRQIKQLRDRLNGH